MKNYGFSDNIGIEDIGFKDGRYYVQLEITDYHRNGFKILHGGVITTLLDAAMARAAFKSDPDDFTAGVTLEMKTNFLKAASHGTVIANGVLLNKTKRTAYVEGEVRNEKGDLLAKSSGTMYLSVMDK